jgi:hypothetical protein
VHFILRHQNPVTGEWEEKHAQDVPQIKVDKKSHVYTLVSACVCMCVYVCLYACGLVAAATNPSLPISSPSWSMPLQVIRPDNSFEILIDGKSEKAGRSVKS